MIFLLTTIHIIICIALIIVVLMQSAKGEGLAGAFGGSGITGAVFGGKGAATFLSKATTVLAIAFFVSCMTLTFVTAGGKGSKAPQSEIQKEAEKAGQTAPPATTVPGEEKPSTGQSPFEQSQPEKK